MTADPLTVKGYTIADEFFRKGFPAGGGPCKCSSVCCSGGVYADIAERDRILADKDIIKKYMDTTQSLDDTTWFDPGDDEDADFPSGRCVGTSVLNDKCVFLNSVGHCSLQSAAMGEGKHKWFWKPFYCVLFPIEVSDKIVSFDPMLQDEQSCCTLQDAFDVPLFEGCREELAYFLGEDGYARVEEHHRRVAGNTAAAARSPEGAARQ
jgi:Protein of unknown function (DUF3109)